MSVKAEARRAAQSKPVEWLGRGGIVARGVLHLLVAAVALKLAIGDESDHADKQGALQLVARQPLGRLLVFLIAIGLLGYSVWRLVQAFVDPDGKGTDLGATIVRISYFLRSVLYFALFVGAIPVILGGGDRGGSHREQEVTARLLGSALGRWVVIAAGIVVFTIGASNLFRLVSGKFREDFKDHELSESVARVRNWAAACGLVARAFVYGLAGVFLVRAAITFHPSEGVGLDAALRELAASRLGPALLVAVAIGLAGYGVYLLVAARYRWVVGS